jgi:hypothetical protein
MEVIPIKSTSSDFWSKLKGDFTLPNGKQISHDGTYKDLSDHYPVMSRQIVTHKKWLTKLVAYKTVVPKRRSFWD